MTSNPLLLLDVRRGDGLSFVAHYAYIAVQRSYVNLGFYHGTSPADPTGLLEGTGKKLRHVKLNDVASARNAAVTALLSQAIAERMRSAAGP